MLDKKEYEKFLEDIYEIIEDGFVHIISYILTEIRKIFNSFDETKKIVLEELLYDEDNLSLKDRIDKHLKETKCSKKLSLLQKILKIFDTESMRLIPKITKKKIRVEYAEIVNSERCEKCEDFSDGELHYLDEIELPPYHPNCHCEAIFYEEEDLVHEKLEDEK